MVAECRVFLSALTSEFGMARDVVANDLQARDLQLLQATNQLAEAEPVMRRHLAIFIEFERQTGHRRPNHVRAIVNYTGLLSEMGQSEADIKAAIASLAAEGCAGGPQ
jgi:hypothetical protein